MADAERPRTATLRRLGSVTPPDAVVEAAREDERDVVTVSDAHYRLLVDGIGDYAIFMLDPTGHVLSWNTGAHRIKGYRAGEIVGQHFSRFYRADDVDRGHPQRELEIATAEGRYEEEGWRVRKDGTEFWANVVITALRDRTGALVGFGKVTRDLTDRRRAEETVRESEERFRLLVSSLRDYAVFMLDPTGIVLTWNHGAERITGYRADEIVGRPFTIFYTPEDLEAGKPKHELEVAASTGRYAEEGRRVRKDGSLFWANVVVTAIHGGGGELKGFAKVTRDVTDRRDLEEQLRQSQKMEAIGRLAGGVAHDFNNLLTAINGYSELLLADLAPSDPRRFEVDEIRKAGERAANLTRQLLAFSRRQVLTPRVVDVAELVAEMQPMLRRLIGEDVELITLAKADEARVVADPGQLEQVVMNLVLNARDAMPRGGTLTIETDVVDLDPKFLSGEWSAREGPHVVLAVSDTGTGMDAQTKARVFEPFFTTKPQGKGTGLGLSTVYGIATQSQGAVWVYSELGKGSTFKVYLPVADRTRAGGAPSWHPEPRGGTEAVLVVEDEAGVRALVADVLRRNGYTVIEARSPDEALETMATVDTAVDVLLTDVVMPGGSGSGLAGTLLRRHPDMRVLYMSGYTDDAIVHHGVLDEGVAFLQKPFTPVVLLTKLREVLDEPPPG